MTDVGPTDILPGNLSEQQLFVLALLAIKADTDADDETARDTVLGIPISMPVDRTPGRYRYSKLSWTVAEEFDKVGLWIRERSWGTKRRYLTSNHSASLSRTIDRLEEHGYIERRGPPTKIIVPTDKGLRAGYEAIRRHQDSRYNLHFDTLPDTPLAD